MGMLVSVSTSKALRKRRLAARPRPRHRCRCSAAPMVATAGRIRRSAASHVLPRGFVIAQLLEQSLSNHGEQHVARTGAQERQAPRIQPARVGGVGRAVGDAGIWVGVARAPAERSFVVQRMITASYSHVPNAQAWYAGRTGLRRWCGVSSRSVISVTGERLDRQRPALRRGLQPIGGRRRK